MPSKIGGFLKKTKAVYKNTPFILEFPKEKENNLDIGKVLLTGVGRELVPVCDSDEVAGFDKYVIKHWTSKGLKVTPVTSSVQKIHS